MASDDGKVRNKPNTAQLLENLQFITHVDTMLLEGMSAPDVARWIQDDKGKLTDLAHGTLVNALILRKRKRRDRMGAMRDVVANHDDDDESAEPPVVVDTPKLMAKSLKDRTDDGVKEILELGALYFAQRDRVDRLMEMEGRAGLFSDKTGNEIAIAGKLLVERAKLRIELGDGKGDEFEVNLSVRGYSKRTVEKLQNPQSRHRIISLLGRLSNMDPGNVEEDIVELPLPEED